jgi:hypothetical protein
MTLKIHSVGSNFTCTRRVTSGASLSVSSLLLFFCDTLPSLYSLASSAAVRCAAAQLQALYQLLAVHADTARSVASSRLATAFHASVTAAAAAGATATATVLLQ